MFLKATYEIILVFLQFFIISLHFFQWEFIPQKQLIQVTSFSYFLGFLIIIISFIILLVAIKDLGRNLSPFPKPVNNSNLVTTGIYRLTRHPMYYSLICISFGVFITKLSIYYLFLSTSLGLIIKFKIALEEQYLNNKFNNYLLYKNEVKY
ncbi:methyltransferase family protein [Prochlorococcus marinus]|nr:methyltransferase [Prochlorococcus marinus]